MICEDVRAAMGAGEFCEETEAGARVVTHCLYPSFEPVSVFVSKFGDGYRVSDGAQAIRCAWVHGREGALTARVLSKEAERFHAKVSGHAIICEAPTIEWLRSAILAVANASASAAHNALNRVVAEVERELKERIFSSLANIAKPDDIGTDVFIVGASGDTRKFDYSVKMANDNLVLLNAVAPHHASIAAKYVAFADTKEIDGGVTRLAVYDRPLDTGDVSLMLQVAELVPIAALDPKVRRALAR